MHLPKPKLKILVGSLIFVSLWSTAVTFATTYVAPGFTLDPSGGPGSYTVTPPISYGNSVTTGHNNEILYNDGSGNLASDSLFTRSTNAVKQTNISSYTYAQGTANDGVSQAVTFQADTIGDVGNSIALVFNGTDTATNVVNAWNLAHPNNTVSIVLGLGTTIPTAGTTNLVGGGTVDFNSGLISSLYLGDIQGSGLKLEDTTNNIRVFNIVGNLSTLSSNSIIGSIFGAVDSDTGNLSAGIFQPDSFKIIATNQDTYSGEVNGDTTEVKVNFNENKFYVDDVSVGWGNDTSNTDYRLPTTDTPTVGKVLGVTGVSGTNYTLGFIPGSSGISYGGDVTTGHNLEMLYIDSSGDLVSASSLTFSTSVLHTPALSINNAYQFPTTDGTSGQMLTTNGLGALIWTPAPVSGTGFTTDAQSNMYVGGAGGTPITGYYNFFAGINAGLNTITGNNNTGVGFNALSLNTSGENNTAFGEYALGSNTIGIRNTAVGVNALVTNTTGNNNVAVGYFALNWNTTGERGTAVGDQSLTFNTTGYDNTANGYRSLYSNTTGNFNTATGSEALYTNTTGVQNTANGYQSLKYNTTGIQNAAFGFNTLSSNTTGGFNTAIGANTLTANTTGTNNTAVGYQVLLNSATGDYNTGVGMNALVNNNGGNHNISIGNQSSFTNVTGNYNIVVGNNADVLNSATSNAIALGYGAIADSNQMVIGSNLTLASHIDSTIIYGSSGTTCTITTGTGMSCSSDERLKKDIIDLDNSSILDKLLNIRTVSYLWKEGPNTHGRQIGFLAQNLEQEFPELVLTDSRGFKSVYYSQITPILVEAIRELNIKVKSIASIPNESSLIDILKNTVVYIKGFVLGSSENPTGFTMYDTITKQPYCVTLANGDFAKTQGECGTIQSGTTGGSVVETSGDVSTTTGDTSSDAVTTGDSNSNTTEEITDGENIDVTEGTGTSDIGVTDSGDDITTDMGTSDTGTGDTTTADSGGNETIDTEIIVE